MDRNTPRSIGGEFRGTSVPPRSARPGRLFRLLSLFLLICTPVAAAKDETFEGRTRVLEVQVPVNVVDRAGNPVRGLTADDFELRDEGERQEISRFQVIDLDLLTPDSDRVMNVDYDIPGVARRHVLFLFDLSFSSPTALARARAAAQKFVLEGLHPSDLAAVAINTVESGTQLLLTFTPDRTQLVRAISTLGNPRLLKLAVRDPLHFLIDDPNDISIQSTLDTGGVTEGISRMEGEVSGYLQVIGNRMAAFERSYARGQVAAWTKTMEEMAQALANVEGRKQIVWFTEGFDGRLLFGRQPDPYDPEFQRESTAIEDGNYYLVDTDNRYGNTQLQLGMVQMFEEFRRANCVVQAVDISGLRADLPAENRARRVGRDALFYVANETGGQLYEDANDFGHELRKVMDSSTVTYLLSFQPSKLRNPGEEHRLKVKVSGVSGATVSHRMSYIEPRPYGELHPIEKNLLAADRIATATIENDLDMNVLAVPFRANEDEAYVPVIVEIDGASLLEGQQGENLVVELYAYATDDKGRMRDFFTQLVTLNLAGRRDQLAATGLKYYGHLQLGPGSHLVRVLARNAETGLTGLRTADVDIPVYADRRPQLLPPFFIEEPGSWFLVREQTEGTDATTTIYPFTVNGEPYIPAASPMVASGGPAEVCLIGYNLGKGDLRLDAQVLSPDGDPLPGGEIRLRERTVTGIEGLDKLVATFRPKGLGAGRYTLEVGVSDQNASSSQVSKIPLIVLE